MVSLTQTLRINDLESLSVISVGDMVQFMCFVIDNDVILFKRLKEWIFLVLSGILFQVAALEKIF